MLDQSFSASNFEKIFDIENRKGNIKKTFLPIEYLTLKEEMNVLVSQQKGMRKRKRNDWSKEEISNYNLNEDTIKMLRSEMDQVLLNDFDTISREVNSRNFRISLTKDTSHNKPVYLLQEDNKALFYTLKCLQYNVKKSFNISTTSRHIILTQIKALFRDNYPKYIIRADISNFYESIPRKSLLDKIEMNNIISVKSKSFIYAILREYDRVKGNNNANGIPRGIGVSAYLSEIFMTDIDRKISLNNDVIYYARYVDDIIIVLSNIGNNDLKSYFNNYIKHQFIDEGLKIHHNQKKFQLITLNSLFNTCSFDFLGYNLSFSKQQNTNIFSLSFKMKKEKVIKYKLRIQKCIERFENNYKHNLKRETKLLINSLKIITGNIKLYNSKNSVKTGVYYSNDLLDDLTDLDILTSYLFLKINRINLTEKMFNKNQSKCFKTTLLRRVQKFDFKHNWDNKTMYNLPLRTIQLIMKCQHAKK